MKYFAPTLTLLLGLVAPQAFAWDNHTLASYRAFEHMPEVANAAPVTVEPLEAFLKTEEKTVEALLASQEAWALVNLENYPVRPKNLAFTANAAQSDEARRQAFLTALRVAPNSKFALYIQPDLQGATMTGTRLPFSAVNTLPEPVHSGYVFIALKPGDPVAPLAVLASASDEPDYGLDINLWDDSPSEWGKTYGFGPLPFGNPALSFATQAPFHMGFFHEDRVLYLAAPFIKKTFPRLRAYQFSTLAALAFRTGHPYWGWRFTGLSLHYLQDLTQPYHASLAPGESTAKLLGVNTLAMLGMPGMKNDMVVLLSNRHLALEKYQKELLQNAARNGQETPLQKALHDASSDPTYPEWDGNYLRDIVSTQSAAYAPKLVQTLLATLPAGYVSDPSFDFGVHEADINLTDELAKRAPQDRAQLDDAIATLMRHFGAHSRNAVRGILKANTNP